MSMPWLADVLRGAGLTVVAHAGWKTRVISGPWSPRYGVVHATAAPRSQSDARQVEIVRDGRSDLDGPIAVACVDRSARWHVLGAGRCNTTLVGTDGPYKGMGNQYAIGVEACNDNAGEPWPRAQYEAYYRGWAAICRRLGWTAANLVGHKEHTPGRKTDPTFSMDQFRRDVAAVLAGEDDDMQLTDKLPLMRGGGVSYSGTTTTVGGILASTNYYLLATRNQVLAELADARARDAAILAAVSGADHGAVLAAITAEGERTRAELAAQAAADAARDADLRALVERGQSGELDADEVVRLIGERLTAAADRA